MRSGRANAPLATGTTLANITTIERPPPVHLRARSTSMVRSAAVLQDSSNTLASSRLASDSKPHSSMAGKRRRVIEDEDEDEEDEEEDEEEDVAKATRDKKPRIAPVQTRQTGRRVASEEDEEEEDEEEEDGDDHEDSSQADESAVAEDPQLAIVAQPTLSRQRSKAGYLPGAILRVKLSHFVTYDAVEFSPGPHLNMIVGPNGTGKSTIVCAIALGLGWTPAVLGRAKDVASYVKEGYDSGIIELELQSPSSRQSNVIIERHLTREDNASSWYLQRRKVTAREIKKAVDSLGIDVSNLCCFLPQDRVAEFANMNTYELLRQTQKAAGQAGMTQWHDQLIDLGKNQSRLTEQIVTAQNEANHLEERVQSLERDVRRAEERHQLEVMVKALDLAVMHSEYKDRKALYDELKQLRSQQQQELRQIKAHLQPFSDRLKELEEEGKEHEAEIGELTKSLSQENKLIKKSADILNGYESDSRKLNDDFEDIRKREKETKRVTAQLRATIAKLEEQTSTQMERPQTRQLDARIRAMRDEGRSLTADTEDARAEEREITNEVRALDSELNEVRKRLNNIDNVKHVRLQELQRSDNDTYRAVMWLRENQGAFQGKVHEPVILEVSMRDRNMAFAVEGCINWITMKTFVCETQADYDTFGRNMDRMRLRVNFCDRGKVKQLDAFQRPTSQQDLERMGFDRYIIDLIDAPDLILRFLCHDSHLHMIPFAQNESAVDVEAVERSGRFQRYITGRNQHTITRSQYGDRNAQTMTRELKKARNLNQTIDHVLRNTLDARIRGIIERKTECERRSRTLAVQKEASKDKGDKLLQAMGQLEQQKGEMLRAYKIWEKATVDLASKRAALQLELDRPSMEAEAQILRTKLERIHDKSAKVLMEYRDLLLKQLEKRTEIDAKQLELLHRHQKGNALRKLKDAHESRFSDAQAVLVQTDARFKEAKAQAQQLMQRTQDTIDQVDAEERAMFNTLQTERASLASLQERLLTEQAKLSYTIDIQPGVLDDYRKRKAQIKTLENNIRQLKLDKERTDGKVRDYRARWENALEELVANVNAKFSRAFSAIGNAGEVRIAKHEDYQQWGIEIMVKFRNEERLQVLTAQRQSGGERSISTITYLLSLTEMSRAPFSLVDEINQGMDQKYERQVHDHMVNVTCSEAAGQYFLITPKLLPGLTYHDRMRVLIINNGEWLPEKFSFNSYIAKMKQRDGSAAGAASGTRAVAVA